MKKFLLPLFLGINILSFSQTVTVKVNDSITYQEIFGFGSYGGYNQNNDAFITNVINDLGLTINRGDFNFPTDAEFDSQKKTYMQNMKAKATANGEPLEFFFSVWTPTPSWKANNSVCDNTCSSKCNAQMDLATTCASTLNYLLPANYTNFATGAATFFKRVKTVTGIEPFAFSIQNEPAYNEPYVSCKYTPAQYNSLLKITKEEFVKQGLTTKFLGPEDMGSAGTLANWTNVIFNDPVTVNYLDIVAVHGYLDGINASTGDATGWTNMYNSVASKKKMFFMSETSGYAGSWLASGSIPGAYDLSKAIYNALKYGKLNAWVWWSLNDNQSPPSAEHYALMYNANPTKNYYVSKNYYRYIRPGAVQVESSSSSLDVSVLSFKNPGSATYTNVKPQFTVVLINNATSARTVSLAGRSLPTTLKAYRTSSSENCVAVADATPSSITLPAQSITTLVYTAATKSPTIAQPADLVVVKNQTNKIVALTNVTNGEGSQSNLTVTAVADNKTLIPGAITVTQSSGSNYNLSFSTATDKVGTAVIRVFVKDGSTTDIMNTTVVKFTVKVIPFVNAAPNINTIVDFTCGLNNKSIKHKIYFTGVNDGNDGSQTISKPTITLSDATKIRLPYVNYTSPQTGGNLEFYPDALGSTTVTMVVADNGGTDLGGKDSKTITFKITVVDNYTYSALENNQAEQLIVYPNPANDLITVDLPGEGYSILEIADLTGKIVQKETIASSSVNVNISGLSQGIYIVVAKGDKGTAKAKISVSR